MTHFGSLLYFILIFLCTFIYVLHAPKKNHFWVKLSVFLIVGGILCYFYPVPHQTSWNDVGKHIYSLVRATAIKTYVVLMLYFSVDITLWKSIAIVFAGVATYMIGYLISLFFAKLPIFLNFSNPWVSRGHLFEIPCVLIIALIFWPTFGHWANKYKYYQSANFVYDIIAIAVIEATGIISNIVFVTGQHDAEIWAVPVYNIFTNILALIIQFFLYRIQYLGQEKAAEKLRWEEEKKQFEISKETIDAINIKVHDLKHRLNKMNSEDVSETDDLLRIYDSRIKTGNDVLDVLLMDYTLRYSKDKISYTFMGDGSILSFMTENDLYSLFGNALENATEAVKKLDDVGKRSISIQINGLGDFISISVKNYFDGNIDFRHSLPVTSKADSMNHGFGTKSMNHLALKYHGSMNIDVEDDIFVLSFRFLIKSMDKSVIK